LLGTWNDDPDDDFTLPDGTVLPSSSSLRDIHFKFGVKCNYIQSCFFLDCFQPLDSFCSRQLRLMVKYIEDITRWREDIKLISSRHRVMFFLLYGD